MTTISVVSPCYNEEGNVEELYERVRAVMLRLGRYRYEHIFIDNASQDGTVAVLRRIAAADRNVKVIENTRNFGHIRSPIHGLHQATGEAVIIFSPICRTRRSCWKR
jgi:polyisoprenyl-phosphate glycosyltransferase